MLVARTAQRLLDQFAHFHDLVLQQFTVVVTVDGAGDSLQRLLSHAMGVIDGPAARHHLPLPDRPVRPMIIDKGIHRRNQRSGGAVRPQAHVHFVQQAGRGYPGQAAHQSLELAGNLGRVAGGFRPVQKYQVQVGTEYHLMPCHPAHAQHRHIVKQLTICPGQLSDHETEDTLSQQGEIFFNFGKRHLSLQKTDEQQQHPLVFY